MDNKSNKITKWLDKEFEHKTTPPLYNLNNTDIEIYYKKNDKHFKDEYNKINELIQFGDDIKNNNLYNYDLDYQKTLIYESKLVKVFYKKKKKSLSIYKSKNT